MRLLGLDPGLRITGWGVLEQRDNRLIWIADGTVTSDEKAGLAERLAQLHRGVAEVIARFAPDEIAVEEVFVNINPASTLKLGQARGAVLTAAGLAGVPVAEYATRLVKKSLVGTGQGDKNQVATMVRRLLPACEIATEDASDALAVAICHAHHRGHAAMLAKLAGAR
ncbi:MAG TPA: crossover junction endodeoxyribonuclease RuvC [Magnetospirillaceae bacterium]|nr:crossover junction endodeoxyribonuclease RuvC [Magnetospirillaceae bacterium]